MDYQEIRHLVTLIAPMSARDAREVLGRYGLTPPQYRDLLPKPVSQESYEARVERSRRQVKAMLGQDLPGLTEEHLEAFRREEAFWEAARTKAASL